MGGKEGCYEEGGRKGRELRGGWEERKGATRRVGGKEGCYEEGGRKGRVL